MTHARQNSISAAPSYNTGMQLTNATAAAALEQRWKGPGVRDVYHLLCVLQVCMHLRMCFF